MTFNDTHSATTHLGLGSNLDDRVVSLRAALFAMDQHPSMSVDFDASVASLFETRPVGGPAGQPDYLNSCVRMVTTLSPHNLLAVLLSIEHSLGRVRREKWGPRTVDIDLLLYDELVVNDAALSLPHPRLHERGFVLEPLAEIAGRLVHPVLHVTIAELARRHRAKYGSEEVVKVAGPAWYTGSDAAAS